MRLDLGRPTRCSDGTPGELADIVIDPHGKRVTHLVMQPEDGPARLVPIGLAAEGGAEGEIALSCTTAEFEAFDTVQEFAYLRLEEAPVEDPKWDVGVENVLAMPYYDSSGFSSFPVDLDPNAGIAYDRVPKGEVEVRRSSPVWSSDGHHLGHVDGFLVDGEHITHVVLERGHLWGKREVAVPIGAVAAVENDQVNLTLSKDAVGDLPSARVRRP